MSWDELRASYGWLLTIMQVITAVGLTGFGCIHTYMAYKYYTSHVENSAGAWCILPYCALYSLAVIAMIVALQIIKKA